MVQATKDSLRELGEGLRDIVLALRGAASGSPQESAVVALLSHLIALEPVRAGELAERACLDPSTVSRHLRSLEADGLLVRTPDPEDGRATLLEVTASGRRAVQTAREQRLAFLADAVSGWPDDDVATLTRLIRRLADSMETT